MKHTLPWNVNGIPPEARELARAAAIRDGLSVGDWLTQRILADGEQPPATPETHEMPPLSPYRLDPVSEPLREHDENPRHDHEDRARGFARTEAETDSSVRRLDEAVRAMSRRIESTERSQTEAHRAMSSAASEINAAARDQAQAFSHLAQRIDRVERQSDTSALREAMRGLHQGLSHLTEQVARTANDSAGQAATFTNSVENLASKLTAAHDETTKFGQTVEDRFAALTKRLNEAEERIAAAARVEEAVAALATRAKSSEERTQEALGRQQASANRLEENLASLEERMNSSQERVQEALSQHLASNNRLEDAIASFEARMNSADERFENTLGQQIASGGRLEENLASLETRMKSSEERLQDALAHHLALGNRLEENLGAFGARIAASEERVQDALGQSGNRYEEGLAALDARLNSAEERMQEALGQQLASGSRLEKTLGTLEAQIKTSEERVQETVGRHLVVIGRNLDNIITRLEQAERRGDAESSIQEGLQLFSQRMDAAEKKSREALAELKTSLGDTAKRIEAMEETQRLAAQPKFQAPPQAQAQAESAPLNPQPETPSHNFDVPPFPDAPPFPSGGYAPLGPVDNSAPMLAPEAADAFEPSPESVSPTAQDYLAQARRAARAAADQATNAASGRSSVRGAALSKARAEGPRFPGVSRAVAGGLLGLAVLSAALLLLRNWLPGSQVSALPSDSAPNQELSLPSPALPAPGGPVGPDQLPQAPASFGDLTNFVNQLPASSEVKEPVVQAPVTPAAGPQTQVADSRPRVAPSSPGKPPGTVPSANPLDPLATKANAGDTKAALLLGLKYADGDGVAVNDTEAARWLQESAKRGNRKAMHNLAVAYANGAGVEKNFAEATRWFKSAAELGLTDSQFNLAVMYERGLGVKASLSEAYKWYAIAAAEGDTESKARIEALATQLQPSDKDVADKAAKAFKPRAVNVAANDPPALP